MARRSASKSRDTVTPRDPESPQFRSLEADLEGQFGKLLQQLPKKLRTRIEKELIVPWDALNPEQRREAAHLRDYQHDPATEAEREYWWQFFVRKDELKRELSEWRKIATPTALDLAKKKERISDLERRLTAMKAEELRASSQMPRSLATEARATDGFIPYPRALKFLSEKCNATPEEIAAWIFMGPTQGGLAAYTNANELNPPPRFFFDLHMGPDYVAPLMATWFNENEIAKFSPNDRYITGKNLIKRWRGFRGIQPEAYIRAKISESSLLDIHPILGGTQASSPEDTGLPPIDAALFLLSHVEFVEQSELGVESGTGPTETSVAAVEPEVGSPEWRKQNARAAAEARHGGPEGSRAKLKEIRTIWESGKYSSKDICAEQECAGLGIAFSTARRALKNLPKPKKPGRC